MSWSHPARRVWAQLVAGLFVLVSLVLLFTVPIVGLGLTGASLVLVLRALRDDQDREQQLERARDRAARWG